MTKENHVMLHIISLFILSSIASADPSTAQTISHPKSECVVKSSSGEYPLYTAYKNNKKVFSPKSDGIYKALFSPNGRYVAFLSGEVSLIDVEPEQFDHQIVVLDCKTLQKKGTGDLKISDNITSWNTSSSKLFIKNKSSIEMKNLFKKPPSLLLKDLHNSIKNDLIKSQATLNLNHKHYLKSFNGTPKNVHSNIYAFYNSKKQISQIRLEHYICGTYKTPPNKELVQNNFKKFAGLLSKKIFKHEPYKVDVSILKNMKKNTRKFDKNKYFNKRTRLSHIFFKCDATGGFGYTVDFFL